MKKENQLYILWKRVGAYPGGKKLFNLLLRRYIPYTGSIKSNVVELKPGYAKITLKQRRFVENHLKSVHAIALANLAEYAGNLALFAGMPNDARLIVKGYSIQYLKKARGLITAESEAPVLETNERRELFIDVYLRDEANDVVCTCTLETLVGPTKNATSK